MTEADRDAVAPAALLMEQLAREAIAELPDGYREAAEAVALRVEDFAPDHLLEDLGIENPFELSGLYEGIPLTEKSTLDQPWQPDTIWLFRRPILDEWVDRGTVPLGRLVRHVLIHELGHHFGWSDEEMGRIDPWWE
jgi:predicted Zn-dependent protease with MMP-like domain